MSAEFRVIHFITDPFLGARIPVAALVRERGSVRLVRATRLPSSECLGGGAYAATLRMILESLEGSSDFNVLPAAVGPLVLMGEQMPAPEGQDAAQWLRRHVLPSPPDSPVKAQGKAPHRASFGYRLFERWNVHTHVKKRFTPKEHWHVLFDQKEVNSAAAASTDPISHWVEGADKVLLMEPLIPHRGQFEKELHSVARSFAAYRYHLEHLAPHKEVALVAYILRSTAQQRREKALVDLRDTAHQVIDLSNASDETAFRDQIRAVGQSAQQALSFS